MNQEKQDHFVEQFLQRQNRIFGFILTLVGNRADAQDLFQQTSLTLWKKWDQYDPSRDFVKWACGVAFNHVRNFKRTRHETGGLELDDDVLELVAQARVDAEDWLAIRREALEQCLQKLPGQQRQLLERCYVGEDSIKTVAAQSQLTPNVLYKKLGAIRKALFDCINRAVGGRTPSIVPQRGAL